MRNPVKANLIKYGITTAIGLALAWAYVALRDFSLQPLMQKYLLLCDAFSIPGLLFVLSGLLMTVSNQGALDGVGYTVSHALRMLIPFKGLQTERYNEYLERRKANRVKGFGFLYLTGLAFLAVSGVFMVLFYSLYQK